MSWRQQGWRYLLILLLILGIGLGGIGCSDRPSEPQQLISEPTEQPNRLTGGISEISPPERIQALGQLLEIYQPQVKITSPRPDQILQEQSVSVRLQVRDLPLYKDEDLGLGPHLHLFVDDRPYQAVYDAAQPVVLEDLAPGTHTLRVFASRPWHESFKNQGAYDQITFHIYAKTPVYNPERDRPLLTYSRPQGRYGAEPIMLDFYLTNVPLHLIAQEDAEDDIPDWRIRCGVNGQSFIFDQWQPIYLQGFKPGKNWVQLELIDEQGNPIPNTFNNTVRVIDYQPGGTDTLSQLVRGELTLAAVKGIVDPTYEPPAVPAAIAPAPEVPTAEPEPEVFPDTPKPEPPQVNPEPSEPLRTQPPAVAEPEESTTPFVDMSKTPLPAADIESPADFRPQPMPAEPPTSEPPALSPEQGQPAPELPVEEIPDTLTQPFPEAEVAPPKSSPVIEQPAKIPAETGKAPQSQESPDAVLQKPPDQNPKANMTAPTADSLPKSSIEPELPDPTEMPVEIIEGFPPDPLQSAVEQDQAAGLETDLPGSDSKKFFNRFRRLQQQIMKDKPAVAPTEQSGEPFPAPSPLEPPPDAVSSPEPTEQPVGLTTELTEN